jgi:tetratricopeptide (TPR) repeat protein
LLGKFAGDKRAAGGVNMSAMNPETGEPETGAETDELSTEDAAKLLDRGREARNNGDLADALKHFKAARRAKQGGAIAHFEVAQTLDLLGRPGKALDIYKKLIERSRHNVRALVGAGLMTFKLGDREAALKLIEEGGVAAQNDPQKLMHVADAFGEISEPQRASEVLRLVVGGPEGTVRRRAIRLLTKLGAQLPDQSTAISILDSAATEAPDDPQIQFSLAEAICLAQPDWTPRGQSRKREPVTHEPNMARAKAVLENLAAQQEGTWKAKALALLARIARYEHRWDDSLSLFETAAAIDPENLNLACQAGFALCDLSRLDDARKRFELVLAKDAKNVEALLGLGDIAKLQDDLKGALFEYERAAALEPTNGAVHARLRALQGRVGGFDWRSEIDAAIKVVQNTGASGGAVAKAAGVLLKYGVTDALQPIMEKLEDTSAAGRQIATAARALDRAGLARTRAQLENNSADDVDLDAMAGAVSKFVPGSETMLVIFGGAAGQIDITFSLFHRLLRTTGASTLFVRDIEQTRYLAGIVGLGRDFDSTVTALRGVAEQSGARRLLMIGNCQGAGAAIRYGVAANAEAVLAFDPRIGLPTTDALRPVDANRLARAMERFGGVGSIDEVYTGAKNKPRLTLIYNTNNEPYATRARELGEIDGVVAAGIPVARSPLLRVLLARGFLTPILNQFVALGRLDEKLLLQLPLLSKE